MTFETGKKIVDMLFAEDAKNSKLINRDNARTIVLDFIGGEPLLKIDLIDKICSYFLNKAVELHHRWQYFYSILITSNGTEYFTPGVQQFTKRFRGHLTLSITVDGNKMLHDSCRKYPDGRPSFDKADRAFRDVLKCGYDNGTKLTISRENLPYLFDAIKNLLSYNGLTEILANTVFEAKWTVDDAKLFYEELKKIADYIIENKWYSKVSITLFDEMIGKPMPGANDNNWCGGGAGVMLAFDSDGNIYPCLRFLPFSMRFRDATCFSMGTLDGGLLVTDKQKKVSSMLDGVTRRSQSTDECFNCPVASGCAWCSGWNYDLYGTIDKRCIFICPMHKARVLANVYYWNTLYRKLDMTNRFACNIPEKWAKEIIGLKEYQMLVNLSKKD